ncbi:WD40 repeat domain-containing protein [Trichormus variabilis]|uniref:WD40 repeat domain-containing protein n=1 Tax=Anabaena variabilis TaxID=264691 RepID=UPI000F8D6B30|nr:WD40 repeat domain-containing protein [Trichormus variabilis]MBD2629340.1 WD40 repeat domain-containing protein [Trichormus variabilis FACHB-164]
MSSTPARRITCLHTLKGHKCDISSLAISPDGQTLVSGSYEDKILVWHLPTGRLLRELSDNNFSIWACSLAIHPHSNILVSTSSYITSNLRYQEHPLILWDLLTGQKIDKLKGHTGAVYALAISPNGKILVSGGLDLEIIVWDLSTRLKCYSLVGEHTDSICCAAFTPDSQILITGSSDYTVRLWDLRTKICQRTFIGHEGAVYNVAICPDGRTILSCSLDGTIKAWDIYTGHLKYTLTESTGVERMALSPNGDFLATICRVQHRAFKEKVFKLWHLPTHNYEIVNGHIDEVNAVAFSPDGQTIVSGSADQTIKVWRIL